MKYCLNCGRTLPDNYERCDCCAAVLVTQEQYQLFAQHYQMLYNQYQAQLQQVQRSIPQTVVYQEPAADTPQKKTKKEKRAKILQRLGYVFIVWLVISLLLTMLLPEDGWSGGNNAAQSGAQTQQQIINILNKTKFDPSFAPTIGQLVTAAFFDYTIDISPYNSESKTRYLVKISGEYCPNPEIPYLSQQGSITYLVDTEKGTCTLQSDPNNLSATFYVYIFN